MLGFWEMAIIGALAIILCLPLLIGLVGLIRSWLDRGSEPPRGKKR